MIRNQVNLDAAFTGFKTLFNGAFERTQTSWQQVATEVPSNTKQEVYPWLGKTTGFRKWVGDRVVQGLATHGFTIKNEHYEDTIGISADDFDDDTIGVYSPAIAQLGEDAKAHPDILMWTLVKAGISSLCYDGQYFFDTDHPAFDANRQPTTAANVDSGGSGDYWYLLDTSRVIKPFIFQKRKDYSFTNLNSSNDDHVFKRNEYLYGVDARVNAGYGLWQLAYASNQVLDATHYAAARKAMQTIRLENGDIMKVTPNLLVVSAGNEGAARTLLNAEIIANTTNTWRNSAQLLVESRLG